jgi:flagellar biosynthetic protein FliQ
MGREALWVSVLLAGPLLAGILLAGVVIGIVQAATSIQEMTLSFVPKLIFIVVALLVIGNWQINVFIDFFERIFLLIPVMLQ